MGRELAASGEGRRLLQFFSATLRMLALASQFGNVLRAFAGLAAVIFSRRRKTATSRMGALFRRTHLKVPLSKRFGPPQSFLAAGLRLNSSICTPKFRLYSPVYGPVVYTLHLALQERILRDFKLNGAMQTATIRAWVSPVIWTRSLGSAEI
jgi:hypothetical protein